MLRLSSVLQQWLRPGVLFPNLTGVAPSAAVPLSALWHNANLVAPTPVTKTGALSGNNQALTAAEVLQGVIFLDVTNGAGFTLTLPSTNSLLSAFSNVLVKDGTFAKEVTVVNNNIGQTGTLTAGDGSTTITGTATIATNTTRRFLMTVTSGTTINFRNMGSLSL